MVTVIHMTLNQFLMDKIKFCSTFFLIREAVSLVTIGKKLSLPFHFHNLFVFKQEVGQNSPSTALFR